MAPFASFVYTIQAQGIVLERQDPLGQGECRIKISITFFEIVYVETISGVVTCSVFFFKT